MPRAQKRKTVSLNRNNSSASFTAEFKTSLQEQAAYQQNHKNRPDWQAERRFSPQFLAGVMTIANGDKSRFNQIMGKLQRAKNPAQMINILRRYNLKNFHDMPPKDQIKPDSPLGLQLAMQSGLNEMFNQQLAMDAGVRESDRLLDAQIRRREFRLHNAYIRDENEEEFEEEQIENIEEDNEEQTDHLKHVNQEQHHELMEFAESFKTETKHETGILHKLENFMHKFLHHSPKIAVAGEVAKAAPSLRG